MYGRKKMVVGNVFTCTHRDQLVTDRPIDYFILHAIIALQGWSVAPMNIISNSY